MTKVAGASIRIDMATAKMLRAELTKVRCWMTGFAAGRHGSNTLAGIPGEDSLRQTIQAIDEGMRDTQKKVAS